MSSLESSPREMVSFTMMSSSSDMTLYCSVSWKLVKKDGM
jgi:hypothetical protein